MKCKNNITRAFYMFTMMWKPWIKTNGRARKKNIVGPLKQTIIYKHKI